MNSETLTTRDAVALDYDMHPAFSVKPSETMLDGTLKPRAPRDGVTLYIRHGRIRAMVEHADGSNSNIAFTATRRFRDGESTVVGGWYSDRYPGLMTAEQSEVLTRITVALASTTVTVGKTLHNFLIHGVGDMHPATRRMIVRRLGAGSDGLKPRRTIQLDNEAETLSGDVYLDLVTSVGASVRAVIDGKVVTA